MNAVNTALAPFVVAPLLLLLTGVRLEAPLAELMLELALIILLPLVAGVSLRSRFPQKVASLDPLYSFGSSLVYMLLLLAVVGPNAATILGYGAYAMVIFAAQLALNLIGYALGAAAGLLTSDRKAKIAFLFTVSKKEFSIAAAVVVTSGLPEEILIPAVFYAVAQMIASPVAVRLLNRQEAEHGP